MSASATRRAAFCGVRRSATASMRIEAQERGARRLGLRLADVRHAVERLAVQVRLLDRVVIDDRETADAGAREILQHRAAEAARADHQHRGGGETRLPRFADLGQHGLAGVAVGHGFLVAAIQALA
jgi:hypothetical protein